MKEVQKVVNPVRLQEFKCRTVCIVSFTNPRLEANGPMPGRFYQVTVDPEKLSPDGKFIRFGANDGDELVGWQPVEWIGIESVLGEWEDGKKPLLEYKPNAGVSLMICND